MDLVSFIYNLLLMILYACAVSSCFYAYINTKDKLYCGMLGLFLYFLFDLSIIYIIEFVYNTPLDLHSISPIGNFAFMRILILTMGLPLYTYFFNCLTGSRWRWYQAVPVVLYIAAATVSLIPFQNRGFYMDCLFYYSRYFSILLTLSMVLWFLNSPGCTLTEEKKRMIRGLDWFIIISMVLSLIETVLVITFWESYASWLSTFAPRLSERIFMEDLYSIILSVWCIYYCQKVVRSKLELSQNTPVMVPLPAVPSNMVDRYMDEFCDSIGLTKREREILRLLLRDKSNQEISDELFISLGTAKTHVHNIFQKADVTKRRQLIDRFQTFIAGRAE